MADEKVALTEAETISEYRPERIELYCPPGQTTGAIRVEFVAPSGKRVVRTEGGEGARKRIVALSKANLSTKSLLRRINEWATSDAPAEGPIAGAAETTA